MTYLGWPGILRLGLVQTALGMVIVLMTATLNRVMVVELGYLAIVAGGLFALYYATQFLRPHFGHGTDRGGRRTPWIIGGVVLLALGGIGASLSVAVMAENRTLGLLAAIPAFLAIGLGIGMAGTNVLALLAATVAPERKAAAGSAVWIMMVAGLASTGIGVSIYLETFTIARLVEISAIICTIAVLMTLIGVAGIERRAIAAPERQERSYRESLRLVWADPVARRFAIFVFAAMFAYNAQDLILEPYAGHVYGMGVDESTLLGSMLHQGALMGMILVLLAKTLGARIARVPTKAFIVVGCIGSGAALVALGLGGQNPESWPIEANVMALGFCNGVFAVAAIGAMMGLASEGEGRQEGVRMGLFGAAQAIAFGVGAFLGTVAVDIARAFVASDATAYGTVFILEGGLFLISALLNLRVEGIGARTPAIVPGE
ncbi:MAG: BCD family MFS transporter [Pseudomonadota bacterium]